MSRTSSDVEDALFRLTEMMSVVLDNDWEMTRDSIGAIAPDATFIRPNVDDEFNNWGNRGSLLAAYRQALAVLRANGRDPEAHDVDDTATEQPTTHISDVPDGTCAFCQSEDVFIPRVGIAFGMGGYDYSFCQRCIASMTADEFWRRLFAMNDYTYPPKLVSDRS